MIGACRNRANYRQFIMACFSIVMKLNRDNNILVSILLFAHGAAFESNRQPEQALPLSSGSLNPKGQDRVEIVIEK